MKERRSRNGITLGTHLPGIFLNLNWLKYRVVAAPPCKMAIPSVPSFEQLSSIFLDEKQCFGFLIEQRILQLQRECICGRIVRYQETRSGFRCAARDCRKSSSVYLGSFFARAILPIHKIMHLAYLWLCKCSVSFALAYTRHSPNTICTYFKYFRQLVGDSLDELDFCIGGMAWKWSWTSRSLAKGSTTEDMQ